MTEINRPRDSWTYPLSSEQVNLKLAQESPFIY
jgi:hypothetical protein